MAFICVFLPHQPSINIIQTYQLSLKIVHLTLQPKHPTLQDSFSTISQLYFLPLFHFN